MFTVHIIQVIWSPLSGCLLWNLDQQLMRLDWGTGEIKLFNVKCQPATFVSSYLLSLADYTQKHFFVEKTFVSVTFPEEVLLIDGKIYFTHVKLTPFHVHNQYSGFWI